MAKKKKKKRRPSGGGGPRPQPTSPGGGAVVGRAAEGAREERRAAARERRVAEQQRRRAIQRRKQIRNISIVVLIVAAIAALVVLRTLQANRNAKRASKIAASAGCSKVKTFHHEGSQHLQAGESTTYDSSPPVGGKHAPAPLAAGVYTEPFSTDPTSATSIFAAVHSLEHGAIIIWYKDLSDAEIKTIDAEFGKETKVLVAPYPQLKDAKIALTAWDRLQTCPKYDTKVVRTFISRHREKTGPENSAQI
jgi:hypothetical protein